MKIFFLCLFLGIRAPANVATCDMMELNHKFDNTGKYSYSQVIFWNKELGIGTYHAKGFKLINQYQKPVKKSGNHYILVTTVSDMQIEVHSRFFTETYTHFDPDMEDRRKMGVTTPPDLLMDAYKFYKEKKNDK